MEDLDRIGWKTGGLGQKRLENWRTWTEKARELDDLDRKGWRTWTEKAGEMEAWIKMAGGLGEERLGYWRNLGYLDKNNMDRKG